MLFFIGKVELHDKWKQGNGTILNSARIVLLSKFNNSNLNPFQGEAISDNGTNFVGAERKFRELVQSTSQWTKRRLQTMLCTRATSGAGIHPALGSPFGGVFESLIKGVQTFVAKEN